MSNPKRAGRMLGVLFFVSATAAGREDAGRPMPAAAVTPNAFGTQDYTITVVSGMEFRGRGAFEDPATLSRTFWYCADPFCWVDNYYTSIELPAGAVIDYIGVNSSTPADATLGFHLHERTADNQRHDLLSWSLPGHTDFRTDYTGLLGIEVPENAGHTYVLDIEHPVIPERSYLGYVEIYWRRRVSNPPASPTFADVPTSHPFFQFIEALASSGITGGCGSGHYCPDSPLTRGQMAVFLAKALGLRWTQ